MRGMSGRTKGRTFTSSYFDNVKVFIITMVATPGKREGSQAFPFKIPPEC
jgi:hypothetical protein